MNLNPATLIVPYIVDQNLETTTRMVYEPPPYNERYDFVVAIGWLMVFLCILVLIFVELYEEELSSLWSKIKSKTQLVSGER